ncbi:MAG: signal peptidase I, partial [Candidatus Aminicenantes bacterium]|nr:signal peptidase I [Candidatus Aminicenantes bacterium]
LSLLFSGLGQVYNGKAGLGIVFFLISAAPLLLWGVLGWSRHFLGLVALFIVGIVLWLFIAVHAFLQARRTRETELKRYQKTAVYAFFIIISLGSTFVPARVWMRPFLGISPYRMYTTPMMPTLHQDDRLMTNPRAYRSQAPQRGDLIIFEYPRDPTKQFIMRVIALEGETIEIKNKQAFINGGPLQEPYKIHEDAATDSARDNFGPLKIPAGHCFVLGDNRDNSNDSRFWGTVPLASVKGQALYVYWAKDKKRIGLKLE